MKEAPLQVPIRRPSGRLSIVVLLGFLWFCSAFLGGYLLGEADASTGSRRLGDLALKVDALLGGLGTGREGVLRPPRDRQPEDDVWRGQGHDRQPWRPQQCLQLAAREGDDRR